MPLNESQNASILKIKNKNSCCLNNGDSSELLEKPFIFRLFAAGQEAGSQCGCRGDGRGANELEQTGAEMGVVGFSFH